MDIENITHGCQKWPARPVRPARLAMLLHSVERSTRFLTTVQVGQRRRINGIGLVLVGVILGGVAPVPPGMSAAVSGGQARCCGRLRVSVHAEGATPQEARPIAGVNVELYPIKTGPGLAFDTDHRGTGVHVGVPEGTYRVRFTHPDFTTVEVTDVTVNTWPTVELVVALPPRVPTRPNLVKRTRYQSSLLNKEDGSVRYVIRN